MFMSVSIPFTHGVNLFELQLFTDYTDGLRIEMHRKFLSLLNENTLLNEFYITSDKLIDFRIACMIIMAIWVIVVIVSLVYGISSYCNSIHFLTKHSSRCYDERILAIFDEAKSIAKLHRNVTLRIVKSDIKISPCTCGTVFPSVFVGQEHIEMYSDTRLKLIFLHELIHVKQGHSLLKMMTLFVTSMFRIIPISKQIRKAINEDCEHICDCKVIESLGEEHLSEYMSMIIDVAWHNVSEHESSEVLSSVSASAELILKRFNVIKNQKSEKNSLKYVIPLLVVTVAVNIFFMSSVSVKSIDDLGVDFTSPFMERAICQYFGLKDPDEITESHLEAIYSIEYLLSGDIVHLTRDESNRYALSLIINDGLVYTGEEYIPLPGYNEGEKFTFEMFPRVIRADMFDRVLPRYFQSSPSIRPWYTELDYEGSEELPLMIYENPDKYTIKTYLEQKRIDGELDIFFISSKNIDTKDISLFKNLKTLIFSNNLKSTDESLYYCQDYAIIERK